MLVLVICFVWGWSAKMMVEEERDFDMPYPNKDQLIIQQGLLTQGKGKGTRLLFKPSDGAIQRIHPSGVFDFLKTEWFRGRYDKPVWREAKIASFKMPSGYAWLAELEFEGKLLASYEKRREDFFTHRRFRDSHILSRVLRQQAQYSYYVGVLVITLAYFISWVQLRKEKTFG